MTDGLFAERKEAAYEALGRLKEIGVRLAMDDFGTGYSSISSLGRLPVDLIKLDRTLIVSIEHKRSNLTIIGDYQPRPSSRTGGSSSGPA